MKNTNYFQIAFIFTLILCIILGISIVWMMQGSDERKAAMESADTRAKDAEKKERDARLEVMTLKKLIGGHKDDAAMQDVQQQFENDMIHYAKNTEEANRSYRAVLQNLAGELVRKNEEHQTSENNRLALEADYNNLNEQYQTMMAKYAAEQKKAFEDLQSARKDFEANLTAQRRAVAEVTAEKDRIRDEAQEQVKEATARAEENEVARRQTQLRNDELAGVIHDIKRQNFEIPDGAILSVNQQAGVVVVNLGSADGLMTRMTFSVYPPSITGISFASDDPDKDAVICEICKRDQSLNASKASIEIIRILGPHKAEARILDDLLTNPIVSGDVIYTPIWKPGQMQHFALGVGMRIPGIGKRDGDPASSDLTEIMRLIRSNGGVVDSYISEGNEEGKTRGEIVGEINANTSFVVIGDVTEEDSQDQDIMEAQTQMIRTADQYAVRKITLRELLSRMGWKNVTPVRGFGDFAIESDMNIVPTGENRTSTGTVSPLYQTRNESARISVDQRKERVSTGTVSGLYSDAPSRERSTGQTSELFRPRKPATNRAELGE